MIKFKFYLRTKIVPSANRMFTEIMVRGVLKIERCYLFVDYQICIKTKRNS